MGLPGVKFPGLGTPGPKNMSGTSKAKAASPTHEFASVASAVDCKFPPSRLLGVVGQWPWSNLRFPINPNSRSRPRPLFWESRFSSGAYVPESVPP
jgi:hypothetical protein